MAAALESKEEKALEVVEDDEDLGPIPIKRLEVNLCDFLCLVVVALTTPCWFGVGRAVVLMQLTSRS